MRRFQITYDSVHGDKGQQVVEAVSYQAAEAHFDATWPKRTRYNEVELAENDPGYTGLLRYNEEHDIWEKDQ